MLTHWAAPIACFGLADIVMGNVPQIVVLLRTLRDKYDFNYLYESLLQDSTSEAISVVGSDVPTDGLNDDDDDRGQSEDDDDDDDDDDIDEDDDEDGSRSGSDEDDEDDEDDMTETATDNGTENGDGSSHTRDLVSPHLPAKEVCDRRVRTAMNACLTRSVERGVRWTV